MLKLNDGPAGARYMRVSPRRGEEEPEVKHEASNLRHIAVPLSSSGNSHITVAKLRPFSCILCMNIEKCPLNHA